MTGNDASQVTCADCQATTPETMPKERGVGGWGAEEAHLPYDGHWPRRFWPVLAELIASWRLWGQQQLPHRADAHKSNVDAAALKIVAIQAQSCPNLTSKLKQLQLEQGNTAATTTTNGPATCNFQIADAATTTTAFKNSCMSPATTTTTITTATTATASMWQWSRKRAAKQQKIQKTISSCPQNAQEKQHGFRSARHN